MSTNLSELNPLNFVLFEFVFCPFLLSRIFIKRSNLKSEVNIHYLCAVFFILIDLQFLSCLTKTVTKKVWLLTVNIHNRKTKEILYDSCIYEIQIKSNRKKEKDQTICFINRMSNERVINKYILRREEIK
jgi:hypothetical protein